MLAPSYGLGLHQPPGRLPGRPAVGVADPRSPARRSCSIGDSCSAASSHLRSGLTPFVFEPIRAAQFPALNEGEPTACDTHFTVACTLEPRDLATCHRPHHREQYGKPDIADRQAPLSAQVGMWWLYFKWQWIRDPHSQHPGLQNARRDVFLVLGVIRRLRALAIRPTQLLVLRRRWSSPSRRRSSTT